MRIIKCVRWGCLAGTLSVPVAGCSMSHSRHHVTAGSQVAAGPAPGAFVAPLESSRPQHPTGVVSASHQQPATNRPKENTQPAPPPGTAAESLPPPRAVSPGETETVAAPVALTLDAAINATLLADPRIRAGFEAINQATAEALTASLRPNPEVVVAQTLLPLTRPFTEEEQGGPPQLDVGVTYPIDWWLFGKRAAAMASAARGVRVSESEFADLIRQRVIETAIAFFDVVEADGLREVARQDVETLELIEDRLRRAVEVGGLPRIELDRIRIELLASRVALREVEATRTAAFAQLWALMGRTDPDPGVEVSAPPTDAPLPPDPPPVEESLAIALQNRPDLEALRWRVDQARADTLVESRNAYPEVRPQLGYTRQFQRRAIGMPDASSWGVGVEMSLPIFDRNQGNRLRAASVLTQSQFEYQAGVVDLRAEIESALAELRATRANAELVSGEQVRLATDIRDSIGQAVEVGGRPVIDILDAQRTFRETYRTFITTRADYWRALYRFQGILGRQVLPHDGHHGRPTPQPAATPRR
jgi:cobalt-zinc-cadmium efflux system outer membrane protein